MKYRALRFLEAVLVVALLFVLFVPIQDYAMSEFKEYVRHPSPQTLKTFQQKNQEESRLREIIAIPLAIVVLALAIPIYRNRKRTTKAP
jgi:hypothetical protein